MTVRLLRTTALLFLLALAASPTTAQDGAERFRPLDVFDLEWSADPRISPDGERVVYVRAGFDVTEDSETSSLWIVDPDGSGHRPLPDGTHSVSEPRWSPSGHRIAYISERDGSWQIRVRWMETGETARLTRLEESPSGLSWSPDGERIACGMFVPEDEEPFAELPDPPEGADWGPPIRVVTVVPAASPTDRGAGNGPGRSMRGRCEAACSTGGTRPGPAVGRDPV